MKNGLDTYLFIETSKIPRKNSASDRVMLSVVWLDGLKNLSGLKQFS